MTPSGRGWRHPPPVDHEEHEDSEGHEVKLVKDNEAKIVKDM